MNCKYCNKECKNGLSVAAHERTCKSNPNRKISNFVKYNTNVKNGIVEKKFTNQFSKAKELGYEIEISEETRKKLSAASKKFRFTDEQKIKLSKSMKLAVLKYPDSYSASNISGRTKSFDYIDSFGNNTKLKGAWELLVAEWLNSNLIKWTNKINPFPYEWNNSTHYYYPDFYLPDFDKYIEVKGYQRERDLAKWKNFKDNLIVLKQNEINLIKDKKFIINL